ncbi:MAG: hypothetical protein PHO92_02780 [Candidatus Peribacteraceae bacterium]|nr:hypothetical protein [Candidatus Peribacteraceae bacterium]
MYKRVVSAVLTGYIASITLGICPLQLSPKDAPGTSHEMVNVETSSHMYVLGEGKETRPSPSCENCLGTASDDASIRNETTPMRQTVHSAYASYFATTTLPIYSLHRNTIAFKAIEQPPPPDGPAMVGVVILRT